MANVMLAVFRRSLPLKTKRHNAYLKSRSRCVDLKRLLYTFRNDTLRWTENYENLSDSSKRSMEELSEFRKIETRSLETEFIQARGEEDFVWPPSYWFEICTRIDGIEIHDAKTVAYREISCQVQISIVSASRGLRTSGLVCVIS